MRFPAIVFAIPLLAAALPMRADLAAIHRDKLPQTNSVLAALDDATQLEPYTDRWTPTWKFPVARREAAARLGKDLAALRAAVKQSPDNEELLLLTALVAHYAYNVEAGNTEKAYGTVKDSLIAAAQLNPSDIRPNWFRADFLCQTNGAAMGAATFLAIESAHNWHDLPPAFWDNYLACALLTKMPAHALRAVDHLKQLNAPPSDLRDAYAGIAQREFTAVDLSKTYNAAQAWYEVPDGSDVEVTSTACGVRLRVKGEWKIDSLGIENGVCTAIFITGPYNAPSGPLHPEILVMTRQPDGQETLADFLSRFTKEGTFTSMQAPTCPAATCLSVKGLKPGGYGENGDGVPRIIVFATDQPEFPGLELETPEALPSSSDGGVQYYRPNQLLQRIPGKLYYLVALDTASSIESNAAADFDWFLQHIQVEGTGQK